MTGHLSIGPPEVLVDEPVRLAVTGCKPGELVTVAASWNIGDQEAWSEAQFVAPDDGVVEPGRLASIGGSYTGVEPYGLWWAIGAAAAQAATESVDPWTVSVTAAGDNWSGAGVLTRLKADRSVQRVDVCAGDLRGIAFVPAGGGPFPAVLLFSGSGGGISTVQCTAALLASHGFATLALAYFNYQDLPPDLVDIPLEYFVAGIDWLTANLAVAGGRVAVMGASRGGELALLLAASYPAAVAAAIALVPSGVVWGGLARGRADDLIAWTRGGEPVPPLRSASALPPTPVYRDGALVLTPSFEARLAAATPDELAAAQIPVERCGGPVLLLSAEDDALWPSVALAQIAVQRANDHGLAHPIRHERYPDAGHLFTRPAGFPIPAGAEHPVTDELLAYGGSPAGNAHASTRAWAEIVAFLRASLPGTGD